MLSLKAPTAKCLSGTVSVSVSAREGIVALVKAHTRSDPSLSSLPTVAIETDRSRPRRLEFRPLPFSTPLSFGRSMLWCSGLLLGHADPISKSHGDLSFLECCCEQSCKRQADAIMYKEFHQQFELHSVVRIFQIDCCGQSLFLPLESFVDILAESGCFFSSGFSCSVPSLVWEKRISPFQVLGKLPGHDLLHQLSRGVLHCEDTVSVQLAMVLARFDDWLEITIRPILVNLSCCEAFFLQSEELALAIY